MRALVDFMLRDWLDAGALYTRTRYADHSDETVSAILDLSERVAREVFAPLNRSADVDEPRLDGQGSVWLPPAAYASAKAYRETGMIAAGADYALGGLQLPAVVECAANAFFARAGIGLGGGAMLTTGAANLIAAYGSETQVDTFARPLFAGDWSGTMCLSETQAGSSLSDILTRALPDPQGRADDPFGARYRLHGQKMWISNGEHELTPNIIHLVLAKIPAEDGTLVAGVRGISLFIVPKRLPEGSGFAASTPNDIALAGLNHKCGYRGMPNTLLNFGEGRHQPDGRSGAVGWLVGEAGRGLEYMFHMMNEARIAVGLGATAIGHAGYTASLEYARQRRQGRPLGPAGKNPSSPQVPIIEHADVRRMLLAQKAYTEGALALVLYAARLVDAIRTAVDEREAHETQQLLDLLTPVVKSWPSEWCLEANSLAIQVLGGCGYTRDFPVEQYWRDNRLNMIHEGAHGIHGLDLLGRKVRQDKGSGFVALLQRMQATAQRAQALAAFAQEGAALAAAAAALTAATRVAASRPEPTEALANATPYLQAFGHTVVGWLWLDLALAALPRASTEARLQGLVHCCRFYFGYEMPRVHVWLAVVADGRREALDMQDGWF